MFQFGATFHIILIAILPDQYFHVATDFISLCVSMEPQGTAHAIPNAIVVQSLDISRCFTTIRSHPRTRVTNMSEMSDRLLEWCKGHSEIPDRPAVFV